MNSGGDIPRFMARHQDQVLEAVKEILQSITAAEEVPQLGDHQGDAQLGDPQEDYQLGPATKA